MIFVPKPEPGEKARGIFILDQRDSAKKVIVTAQTFQMPQKSRNASNSAFDYMKGRFTIFPRTAAQHHLVAFSTYDLKMAPSPALNVEKTQTAGLSTHYGRIEKIRLAGHRHASPPHGILQRPGVSHGNAHPRRPGHAGGYCLKTNRTHGRVCFGNFHHGGLLFAQRAGRIFRHGLVPSSVCRSVAPKRPLTPDDVDAVLSSEPALTWAFCSGTSFDIISGS